jgi:hypothetical protein
MSRRTRELFAAEAPEGCALTYRNLIRPKHRGAVAARQRCEEMWRAFEPFADPNFLERLPFEFHQRWFEMYLGASLVTAGIEVRAPKPGPDFEISAGSQRIFIEAVAPTPGNPQHADAVSEPVYVDVEGRAIAVEVPHDLITLRIASAVRAKLDVFDRYRSRGLVSANDACIVAVNLRDIPQAWADSKEFFFRAVYGMGNRVLVIDPAARKIVAAGREHRMILPRASGAAEAVAPMLDPEHADVCAILGSAADVGNVPDLLGDDFVIMPHASAQVPFPRGFFGRGVEINLLPGGESGSWTVEEADYGAPEPRGPEKFTVEHEGTTFDGEWQIAGRELHIRLANCSSAVPFRNYRDPASAAREIAIEMLRVYGGKRVSRVSRPKGNRQA